MPTIKISNITQSRVFNGTTNYITEYILMIISLAGLVTSVILIVFSICNLLTAGDVAGLSVASALSAAVSFMVFGPLYAALSRRVRTQEIKQPAVLSHKARTVFFVLASVSVFGWITGFLVTSVYFLLKPLIGHDASYGDNLINVFLPSIVAVAVIASAYASLAKSATTKYVSKFASVALLVGLILAIAGVSVAINKKDVKPTLKAGESCTFENYQKHKCSFEEYQKYDEQQYPKYYDNSPTTKYDDYQDSNGINNMYNY